MAVLVSTAMAFSSIGPSAFAAGEPTKQTTQTAAKNQSPLPAGGAAGIKQAQGGGDNSALISWWPYCRLNRSRHPVGR
jgi:hypothetical protein